MGDVTIPPFDPNGTCPKCGHDDVSTHYEAHTHHGYKSCTMPDLPHPQCCEAEHFERSCQRCHYRWAEGVER